jgi:hypothetical protein
MAAQPADRTFLGTSRPSPEVTEMNGSSTRLAASIMQDRHREAAQIRAARAAQPPTSRSWAHGRLLDVAVANTRSAWRSARAFRPRETKAASD